MYKLWGCSCDALYWIQNIDLQNVYKYIKQVEVNLMVKINNTAKAEDLFLDSICTWYSIPKANLPFRYKYCRWISWY